MGLLSDWGITRDVPDEKEKSETKQTKKSVFGFKKNTQEEAPETAAYVPVSPLYNQYSSTGANPEDVETFRQMVKDRNFPGLDFLEFIGATKSPELAEVVSEKGKFCAAYIGFKMSNITKGKLLETGQKYVSSLDDEISNIEKAFEQSQQQNASKQKAIESKQAELVELQKKQQAIADEINRLNQEIVETNTVVSTKKNSLITAANIVKSEILADVEKIKNYLAD